MIDRDYYDAHDPTKVEVVCGMRYPVQCAHDACRRCYGSGVDDRGFPCAHGLVCYCRKCQVISLA